jgi:hypothetical protein
MSAPFGGAVFGGPAQCASAAMAARTSSLCIVSPPGFDATEEYLHKPDTYGGTLASCRPQFGVQAGVAFIVRAGVNPPSRRSGLRHSRPSPRRRTPFEPPCRKPTRRHTPETRRNPSPLTPAYSYAETTRLLHTLRVVPIGGKCELARNNAPLRGGFRVQSRPL